MPLHTPRSVCFLIGALAAGGAYWSASIGVDPIALGFAAVAALSFLLGIVP